VTTEEAAKAKQRDQERDRAAPDVPVRTALHRAARWAPVRVFMPPVEQLEDYLEFAPRRRGDRGGPENPDFRWKVMAAFRPSHE